MAVRGKRDIMEVTKRVLHDVEWTEQEWRFEMRYVVVLHEQPSGTYVAVAPAAPGCTAEGKTREEALQRLRVAVQEWLADVEITSIDVEVPGAEDGSGRNPWLETAGIFADDPTLACLLSEAYQVRDAERQVE